MPKSTNVGTWLLAGAALLPTGTVLGADGTHRCASVAADDARLECYDAAFGRPAGTASTAATTRSVPQGVDPATPIPGSVAGAAGTAAGTSNAGDGTASKAREDFGLSEVDKRARKPQEELEPTSITSTVIKISSRPAGELVLTLEDGQVWTQVEFDARFRARAGDTVTIRQATLGSYLMVGPARIATRVRRVK